MVQYIITPWRNQQELLAAREAFYPPPGTDAGKVVEDQRKAVALVSVWVQRGNCPHSVESTALLLAAVLNEAVSNSAYAMRAAYSTAFCRFVTGLLDGYQDKKHKLSMYSIAKKIGLPATFVELRHQCTHEELPTLSKLRAAAEKSLLWIWDQYWKNLETTDAPLDIKECRSTFMEYLHWRAGVESEDEDERRNFVRRLGKWTPSQVLEAAMQCIDTGNIDTGMLLYSLRISGAILEGRADYLAADSVQAPIQAMDETEAFERIRTQMAITERALDEKEKREKSVEMPPVPEQDVEMGEDEQDESPTGWVKWKGPWQAKPIGVV